MADDPADLLDAARERRSRRAGPPALAGRARRRRRPRRRPAHPPRRRAAYTVGHHRCARARASRRSPTRCCGSSGPRDDAVAVLAIDPSSPFTGGAILGDRVRMSDHATDDGVFIRSMATRGHLGGLSLATLEAVRVLDAAGWPWILIETVGVGQVEVEVAGAADTTVVVVNPGLGRRGAGQQGRPARDRRRVRDQQGRPPGRRRDPPRPRAHARPHRPRRLAPAGGGHDRGHRRRGTGAVGRHRRAPPAPHHHRRPRAAPRRRGCRTSSCASSRRCSTSGRSRPVDETSRTCRPRWRPGAVDPWSAAEQLLLDRAGSVPAPCRASYTSSGATTAWPSCAWTTPRSTRCRRRCCASSPRWPRACATTRPARWWSPAATASSRPARRSPSSAPPRRPPR